MGNLVSNSANEPDNRRAPTSTAQLPTERDNDAALALGARPNQEHEPEARHIPKQVQGDLCRKIPKLGLTTDAEHAANLAHVNMWS